MIIIFIMIIMIILMNMVTEGGSMLLYFKPGSHPWDTRIQVKLRKRNFIRPKSDRCLALSVIESLNALVEVCSRFEVELTQPEVRFVPETKKMKKCCLIMISISSLLGAKLFVSDNIKASHLLPQPVAHTLPVRAMEVSAKGSSWRNMKK